MIEAEVFDVHTHVNFTAYHTDRKKVMESIAMERIGTIIVGTQEATSRTAIEVSRKISDQFHIESYAAIGLHPIHTTKSFHDVQELGEEERGGFISRGEEFDPVLYRNLAKESHVVAIGECGLDYYRLDEESRTKQVVAFRQQIELSVELNLALMLHVRPSDKNGDAYFDVLNILSEYPSAKGNVHFFAGTYDIAKKFYDIGFTTSFTGVLTFARDYDDVVINAPLSMILTETDAPYITPVPYRGKRNEPIYVKEVVKKIAELRGISYEEVARATVANTRRVFGL